MIGKVLVKVEGEEGERVVAEWHLLERTNRDVSPGRVYWAIYVPEPDGPFASVRGMFPTREQAESFMFRTTSDLALQGLRRTEASWRIQWDEEVTK